MNGEAFLSVGTVSLAFCLVCFVATVYLGTDYREERHHRPIEIGQLAFIHVCKECLDEFAGIFIRQIIDGCSMLGEKQNGVSIFLHRLLLSVPLSVPLSFLRSVVLRH